MAATWIQLLIPAFGSPAGAVLVIDSADARLPQLLNAGLATQVGNPGSSPPGVPAPNPGGDYATDAELLDPATALGASLKAAFVAAGRVLPVADTATTVGPYWVTNQPGTSRTSHVSGGAASDLQLVFPNWVSTPNNPFGDLDASNGGPIPIRAAIEYPEGTITPLFFNGQRDGSLGDGATLTTDPVGVEIPPGTQFWVRAYLNVPTGYKWPQVVNSSGNTTGSGFASGDLTAPGSASIARSDSYLFGPVAIRGRSTATRAVAIVGDSVAAGIGDLQTIDYVGPNGGFVARALTGAGITWVSIAMPGEISARFTGAPTGHIRRGPIITGCTSAICNYGDNDLQVGLSPTFSGVAGALVLAWRALAVRGMKVWQTTITPNTDSADTWATVAGQTIANETRNNTVRVAVNDWIRAGAPLDPTALTPVAAGTSGALLAGQTGHYLTGYFETADTVETARNSGIWKATGSANGYTADGLHPSPAGHAAMAGAIDVAKLT